MAHLYFQLFKIFIVLFHIKGWDIIWQCHVVIQTSFFSNENQPIILQIVKPYDFLKILFNQYHKSQCKRVVYGLLKSIQV